MGYILYGLILGVVYATFDRAWVRLFIESDPLNREPEGPGFRLFRSLQWGGLAGLAGGLVSSPFMFAAHVLSSVAGVEHATVDLERPAGSSARQHPNRNELRRIVP